MDGSQERNLILLTMTLFVAVNSCRMADHLQDIAIQLRADARERAMHPPMVRPAP